MFRALGLTPLETVKVVILGQDPYHGDGQATGLAFDCPKRFPECPPTLKNIVVELQMDTGLFPPAVPDLSKWAKQGVLLWNSYLSVSPNAPMSHHNLGWQNLTDDVIAAVRKTNPDAVFILWGKEAENTAGAHMRGAHRIISPHPSPQSANKGFFKSRPFTKTNAILQNTKQTPVDWRL
jgi:uracil-DNA glycosylase